MIKVMIYHASAFRPTSRNSKRSPIGRALLIFATALIPALSSGAKESDSQSTHTSPPPEQEAAVRLQIFLDRAQFAPGKIDGRYGDFTLRALDLYREANALAAPSSGNALVDSKENKSVATPVVTDLDLSSVGPLYIDYTVSEADLVSVGKLPDAVEAQSKLKSMPYRSVGEAIAEKFHTDLKFLEQLNPGSIGSLKAGDPLKVPNVEPFDLAAVKDLILPKKNDDDPAADSTKKSDGKAADSNNPKEEDSQAARSVKVDTKTSMLSLYENDRLIAAYPVTIGANQNESPIGAWKITGVAKMPDFRHDEAVLKRGERSSDFHVLPPGPNNPVGVIWIQLNKKGIGLHGTSSPDTIGRSESHGCIRLANWDIIRLAAQVKAGVAVDIH